MKEKVLQAMREFGQPVNAGKIAEITGIDRKEVDKAFAELKKEGAIVSPVRCKWEPAKLFNGFDECIRTSTHINFFFTGRCCRSDCTTIQTPCKTVPLFSNY